SPAPRRLALRGARRGSEGAGTATSRASARATSYGGRLQLQGGTGSRAGPLDHANDCTRAASYERDTRWSLRERRARGRAKRAGSEDPAGFARRGEGRSPSPIE